MMASMNDFESHIRQRRNRKTVSVCVEKDQVNGITCLGKFNVGNSRDTEMGGIERPRHGPRGPVSRVKPIVINWIGNPKKIVRVSGSPKEQSETNKDRPRKTAESRRFQITDEAKEKKVFHVTVIEGMR